MGYHKETQIKQWDRERQAEQLAQRTEDILDAFLDAELSELFVVHEPMESDDHNLIRIDGEGCEGANNTLWVRVGHGERVYAVHSYYRPRWRDYLVNVDKRLSGYLTELFDAFTRNKKPKIE